MIDELTIRRVKEAASIVDVLDEFGYELQRKGKNYLCLCPFHDDRHIGSFVVNPNRNTYTCYSCGAHGDPIGFLIQHERMTFVDALRWLGRKYGIEVEGSERFQYVKKREPRTPPPPLPMLTLSPEYVRHYRQNLGEDVLVQWIKHLPWDAPQRARIDEVLRNYMVGTTHEGGDFTIFWQVDEKARLRTGKMMKYRANGHRRKEGKYNNDWMHSRLERRHLYDPTKVEYKTCYFGQHLIDAFPNATINIVESEKTALIMAIAYGDYEQRLWIACGGKGHLNRQEMLPLIERNRHIVLYPDKDAVEEWRQLALATGYKRISIDDEYLIKYWKPEDGPKADIADLMERWLHENEERRKKPKQEEPPRPSTPFEMMAAENPVLGDMINKFNLIEVTK